jgi:hypothetical protein
MQITVKENFVGAKALDHKVKRGILTGLYAAGENIKESAEPITPKLTGDLRSSAKISLSGSGAGTSGITVSYNMHYAYEQEFGPAYGYKNYTTPGTGPFYLYKTFKANEFETVNIIAQSIAGGLKGLRF